jgi:hypothetical protein
VVTLPDGSYSISALGDGTYLLTISAPGYASVSQQVALTSGMVLPLEVPLQPLPGSIEGTITSAASGATVAGATVAVAEWRTETDTSGRYRLVGLPPGAYTLQVSVAGYQAYQAGVTVGRGTSGTIDITLTPLAATLQVKVVDATTGSPLAGAKISYGAVGATGLPVAALPAGGGTGEEQPCADVTLLVPLKRSAEFAAIRRRVADPHHSDAWVEDGLHFFVYQLHPVEDAGQAPPGANGAAPGRPTAQAPVAVFAMDPASSTVHSAVVVTSGPDGAEAEVRDLRAPESAYTLPAAWADMGRDG